ncbi:MAG: hypothetical protein A2341_22705 [Deltaproteobacteria bacterium RIFOXYB12_FULL_58_9]|nr:MAG: hypothetical protein A2341_22705 [Deltaproteobacteria bacterium RIFOXYB12_FULL_58_9]
MSTSTQPNIRIHALDLLRGLCIFMMCEQYFTYAIATYFGVPLDPYLRGQWQVCTPVVTQMFVALAAFNLGAKERSIFAETLPQKLFVYATVFCVFAFELFFVAIPHRFVPSEGHLFEFNALMCWMTCLAVVAIAYRFLSTKILVGVFALQCVFWALPMQHLDDKVESGVSNLIGLPFKLDVRPHLFIGSALLGLLLGIFYHRGHALHQRWWPTLMGLGAFAYMMWLVFGAPFYVGAMQPYKTEFDVAKSFIGMLGTWGLETVLILGALWPLRFGKNYRVPLLCWAGASSLLIYTAHKLIFGSIFLPFLELIAIHIAPGPVSNTLVHIVFYVLLVLGIVYMLQQFFIPLLLPRSARPARDEQP